MFQRILVPLDGSPRAEQAIPVAARLARASHGSVVLTRAVTVATEFWPAVPMQPEIVGTAIDATIEDAKAYLMQIAALPTLTGVSVEVVTQFGPAASTILQVASTDHCDMIVLCSHGYTGVQLALLGSVAENVAHHASIPVLLLREHHSIPAGPHPDALQPLRILVGLDGSTHAKTAIQPAAMLIAALASPATGALHLTEVINPSRVKTDNIPQQDLKDAVEKTKQSLRKVIENIRDGYEAPSVSRLDLQLTCSVALGNNIAETLTRVAENGEDTEGAGVFGGCDIIALSTHGYSGLQHMAIGSVTEHVLKLTKLPVLIVHPQKTKKSGEEIAPLTHLTQPAASGTAG